jgi:hypothetical protein
MDTIKSERTDKIASWIGKPTTWDFLISRHSNTMPKDFTVLVIMAGMVFIFLRSKLLKKKEGVLYSKAALIIATVITLGMFFVAKFPTYYGWMLSFPLAVILGSYFDQANSADFIERKAVFCFSVLGCAVGLPMQVGLASHDWNDRSPAGITRWIEPRITKDDVVYCDYPFYYIAKQRAKLVFTGQYFKKMTQAERDSITLFMIGKNHSDWNQSEYNLTNNIMTGTWTPSKTGILGNDWQYGILSAVNYSCVLYSSRGPRK